METVTSEIAKIYVIIVMLTAVIIVFGTDIQKEMDKNFTVSQKTTQNQILEQNSNDRNNKNKIGKEEKVSNKVVKNGNEDSYTMIKLIKIIGKGIVKIIGLSIAILLSYISLSFIRIKYGKYKIKKNRI